MKKNAIALLLSVVLAAGCVGAAPVYAAETTAEEAVAVEEAAVPEDVAEPETVEVLEEADIPEEEAKSEEAPDDTIEEPDGMTIEETSEETALEEAHFQEVVSDDNSDEQDETSDVAVTDEAEEIEEETGAAEDNNAYQTDGVIDSGYWGDDIIYTATMTGEDITLSFSGSGPMKEVIMGSTDIPWHGYRDKIKTIVIEDGISSICKNAFSGCTKMTNVTIPDSVTVIGNSAFYNCNGLTEITVPKNVTCVEYSAFAECQNLKSITFPDSMSSFEVYFGGCYRLESIKIPKGATQIRSGAFRSCYSLKSVTIPDGVTSIGVNAFYDCDSLESITIPDSVKAIYDEAFSSCIKLRRIAIPASVTSIGDYAFSGCVELESILIPKSVTSIGNYCIFNAYDENKATVRYCGSKDEWDSLTKGKRIYYKSILYNCFSVDADFTLSGTSFSYNGKEIKPSVKVVYRGKNLKAGTDYKLSYKNNKIPGTATVDVIGIGEYSGTETLSFEILPIVLGATKKVTCTNVASGIKVSWEEVMGATSYYVYRDDKYLFRTSALNITDKEVKYNSGTKYVYKVVATAKGVGDSPKARTATMYRLMPVGIKSLTNPSVGKMTVSYDKAGGSSGYVVRFGLKSDMSDAKVITVSGQNTLSRTFGGMQKGKTYYVQVRTYKIENGVRYYSGYCTTKKIVIRK